MNIENFKSWLAAAGIRAVKTFAQTAASLITVGAMITEIDWRMVLSVAAVAGIYSLLTSCAGLPEVELKKTLHIFKTKLDNISDVPDAEPEE